jgi:hypothetical protein
VAVRKNNYYAGKGMMDKTRLDEAVLKGSWHDFAIWVL